MCVGGGGGAGRGGGWKRGIREGRKHTVSSSSSSLFGFNYLNRVKCKGC